MPVCYLALLQGHYLYFCVIKITPDVCHAECKVTPSSFPVWRLNDSAFVVSAIMVRTYDAVSSYKQDSVWSWFICFCFTACMMLTIGFAFALGVLFPVLMDSFNESRERIGKFKCLNLSTLIILVVLLEPGVYAYVFIELIRCLHACHNIETATADVCAYSQFYSGNFGSTKWIIPLELICSGALTASNIRILLWWKSGFFFVEV